MATHSTLTIRFANPDHTPARYQARGYGIGVSPIMQGDYWTLTGPSDILRCYVQRVLEANDLNDYTLAATPVRTVTTEGWPLWR